MDGVRADPNHPFQLASGDLSVRMNGLFVRIATSFGLVVEYDGFWTVAVRLPANYESQTEGLCGNSNLDPDDDMITRDGVNVNDDDHAEDLFANSWMVYNPDDPKYYIVFFVDVKFIFMSKDLCFFTILCHILFFLQLSCT